MEGGLGRGLRDVEVVSNLREGPFSKATQMHNRTRSWREHAQSMHYMLMKFLLFEEVFWHRLPIWDRLSEKRLLLAVLPFQLRKEDDLPTLFFAQFVQTLMVRDAEEPGFER